MSVGRVSVGHPIDIASGAVFTVQQDFCLPGTLELAWRRRFSTDSSVDSWLGRGWSVPYFMKLEKTEEGYQLQDEDGGSLVFPTDGNELAVGKTIDSFGANMTLHRGEDVFTILHWHHGSDDVEYFRFDARAIDYFHLLCIENLAGHRISMSYDASNRLHRIHQELEDRVIQVNYGPSGRIITIDFIDETSNHLLLTQYKYDTHGRLVEAIDAVGGTSRYQYDSLNRMVGETNPIGGEFIFEYDQNGRCVYSSGTGGYMRRHVRYQSAPNQRFVIDSLGHETSYLLNPAGQVIQEISPLGAVTTSTYDEFGRLLSVQDALGATTRYCYDDLGNRASVEHPDGSSSQFRHNAFHLMTEYVDPDGNGWRYEYDHRGNAVALINPLGSRLMWTRRQDGLITKITTPGGREIYRTYGEKLRSVVFSDQISLIQAVNFDRFGNQISHSDSLGLLEQTKYDLKNRPTQAIDRNGRRRTIQWNALDMPVERVGADISWERRKYDSFGRIVGHENPLGSMAIEYDTEGKMLRCINRVFESLSRNYDADGNMISEMGFDGRIEKFEYDLTHRLTKAIKSDNRTITYRYNTCGDLIERMSSDGLHEVFAYNLRGQLILAENRDSIVRLERDASGCVVAEVQNDRKIEYQLDPDQQRLGRTIADIPGGTLTYKRDLRGRLIQIEDERGPCHTMGWDEVDRLVSRGVPGGVQEGRSYGLDGNLARQVVKSGQIGTLIARDYRFDTMDCLLGVSDPRDGNLDFTHDVLGRLVEVRRQGVKAEEYAYDANGSIVQTHDGPRSVGRGGRTITDGNQSYRYDTAGNVCEIESPKRRQTLQYNVDGQVTRIQQSGSITKYIYDALGRRIGKSFDNQKIEFLWEGCVLAAKVIDGQASDSYFFHGLVPILWWRDGERLVPVSNSSGLIDNIFSESGRPAWNGEFNAYGRLLREKGECSSPFRFRGQYFDDESGLHHNFRRTYSPDLGGYLSPDPLGLDGGANFYGYPRNPLDWDDPFGLKCGTDACKAEEEMTKKMDNLGFDIISDQNKHVYANGIDAVYMNRDPNGTPKYIIAEAKSGSAVLGWSGKNENIQQLSDKWINSPAGNSSEKRLDAAFPPNTTHADDIRALAGTGQVEKKEYHPDRGFTDHGTYDKPKGGKWTL